GGAGPREGPGRGPPAGGRRRARDRQRRQRRAGARAEQVAYEAALGLTNETPDAMDSEAIPDDRLRLIFTCCHPGLTLDSRVALTLKLVGGLSTPEIARASLAPDPTTRQRLGAAKRPTRDPGRPSGGPARARLPRRPPPGRAAAYLIFNEGYTAHSGPALMRRDLCEEALRLGRMLAETMPDEPEVLGLVALMEFQVSRAATRTDAEGNLVLLEDQDRSRWDQ